MKHKNYLAGIEIVVVTTHDKYIQSKPTECPKCKMVGVFYYIPDTVEFTKKTHKCTSCQNRFIV